MNENQRGAGTSTVGPDASMMLDWHWLGVGMRSAAKVADLVGPRHKKYYTLLRVAFECRERRAGIISRVELGLRRSMRRQGDPDWWDGPGYYAPRCDGYTSVVDWAWVAGLESDRPGDCARRRGRGTAYAAHRPEDLD